MALINELIKYVELRKGILSEQNKVISKEMQNNLRPYLFNLFVNDYNIINGGWNGWWELEEYKKEIIDLINNDAPIDSIGVQCHMDHNFFDPNKILSRFQSLSELEKDIWVTEFDVNGPNVFDNNNELNYLSYWVLVIISGFVSSFIILLLSFGSLSLKEFFINNLSLTKNESNSLIYLLNGLLIILYIVYVLAEV